MNWLWKKKAMKLKPQWKGRVLGLKCWILIPMMIISKAKEKRYYNWKMRSLFTIVCTMFQQAIENCTSCSSYAMLRVMCWKTFSVIFSIFNLKSFFHWLLTPYQMWSSSVQFWKSYPADGQRDRQIPLSGPLNIFSFQHFIGLERTKCKTISEKNRMGENLTPVDVITNVLQNACN